MEYSSTLYFGVDSAITPHASMPPRGDDQGVSSSVHLDLNIARTRKVSLLVVGSDRLVANLLSVVVPDLNQSAVIRSQNGRLLLPPASSRLGTIVVRDVDALALEEQCRLLEWLESLQNRTQVVSTASAPLLTRVESGEFNDTLYYRLNKIYIDLSE